MSSTSAAHAAWRSDAGKVVLGSLLYTAGSGFQYVLPAYLGELSAQLGVNESQMGAVAAAENAGIAIASIASMLWLTRADRRILAMAAAVLCASLDLMAFFMRSVEGVLAVRFLTGLLGEGLLFALAFLVLSATRNPDRAFGISLTVVVIFGSVVLGASPYLDRVPRGPGILLPLAVAALTVLCGLKWMPSAQRMPAIEPDRGRGGTVNGVIGLSSTSPGRSAVVAVVGMAVWFAAPGAFWTFAESAAAARGVSGDAISVSLAVGNGVGLLGSALAAWQANRWGRFWPLLITTLCLCASVVAFQHSRSVMALTGALAAFNVFWNYGAVYEMALVASLDVTSRVSLAIPASQMMGFAAGGFLSGLVITKTGYGALSGSVTALAVAGMLILALCTRTAADQPVSG